MNLFDNPLWIINEPLYGQKLMVVILLFETAGMKVINVDFGRYPYLAKSSQPKYCKVSARTKIEGENYQISYDRAIKELTKIISNDK